MRHFNHVSLSERHVIQKMKYSGFKKYEIGNFLGRHHSTIYREYARNKTRGYQYNEAHAIAKERHCKKKNKLDNNGLLRLLVITLLSNYNSPELISYYLKVNFPDEPTMNISHESIYKWLYKHKNPSLLKFLFTKRAKRQIRSNKYKKRNIVSGKKNIRERPVEAEEKSEAGHLEGDLIFSKNQDKYALTLVDRNNMHVWGLPVNSKDPEEVCRAVVETLDHLPDGYIKTITFDNGTEFNSYRIIEKALNCKVYFADPYSSWQRGLNEHLNGRIRQFLPKKKSFAGLTDEEFKDILFIINSRPRKSRNWSSPISLLEESLFAFET